MKILEYEGLDAAGGYCRAKLGYANRLLFEIHRAGDQRYALVLEVIRNHEYEKSRFLRGVRVDEERVPALSPGSPGEGETAALPSLSYVSRASQRFHFPDKPISFDEAQAELFRLPSPLIIIGSAGSGKTALTLEKLKQAKEDALYVTLSAFLDDFLEAGILFLYINKLNIQ